MPSEMTLFHLEDVQFFIGSHCYQAHTIPIMDLNRVTFATLTFTTQKNSVQGEVIGLGCSDEPIVCRVLSLARRIQHLRENNAPPDTPLASYYENG